MNNNKIPEDYSAQFSKWVSSLENYERVFFFNKISLACDVSYQTVYCWSVMSRKIRKPFAEIINKVVGENVIEL